jgi:pimeloyl-ACP methyl ester carboxylesterase
MNIHVTPAQRTTAVTLSDGRRLAWSEWGPADGIPVIFCTGAGMSGALGLDPICLESLGIRLLAVDRPGLGNSEPHPAKTLSTWATDIGELMGARGIHAPVTIGFSQGAPFALALAASGRARAAAVVAGQDDLGHPSIFASLRPGVAKLVAGCRDAPQRFEDEIAGTASAEWLWNVTLEMSSSEDRRIFAAEPFASLYQRSLREGFSQGARGYARDLANALGEWPFRLESIPVAVSLWYGLLDTSPVHSPFFGATLASRIPGATLAVDRAAGSAILWTRTADILRDLVARSWDAI